MEKMEDGGAGESIAYCLVSHRCSSSFPAGAPSLWPLQLCHTHRVLAWEGSNCCYCRVLRWRMANCCQGREPIGGACHARPRAKMSQMG